MILICICHHNANITLYKDDMYCDGTSGYVSQHTPATHILLQSKALLLSIFIYSIVPGIFTIIAI